MVKSKKTTNVPIPQKVVLIGGIGIVVLLFLLSLGTFLSFALFLGIAVIVLNFLILSGAKVGESSVRLALLLSVLAIVYGLYAVYPMVAQSAGV